MCTFKGPGPQHSADLQRMWPCDRVETRHKACKAFPARFTSDPLRLSKHCVPTPSARLMTVAPRPHRATPPTTQLHLLERPSHFAPHRHRHYSKLSMISSFKWPLSHPLPPLEALLYPSVCPMQDSITVHSRTDFRKLLKEVITSSA